MSSFIQHLRKYSFRYNDKLLKFCKPLFDHFGASHFCYYKITNSGHYITLASHLEFSEFFFSENHHINCPYLLHPKHYQTGLSITRNIMDTDFQYRQKATNEKFNFALSASYLERSSDDFQGYAIGTNNPQCENLVINEMPLFLLFIRKFKESFSSILKQMNDEPLDIATPAGPAFHNKDILFNFRMKQRETYLTQLGIHDLPSLSPRERKLLSYIIKGCTSKQIAEEFVLSKRTIESYIDTLKLKLNCNSKFELIQKLNEYSSFGCIDSI
jgi:DNA-binding CsgD family transcriptional regulator